MLVAATEAFATDGPGVTVAEIARRAGVGTGTVSRHFPTKRALYDAIVQDKIEKLETEAAALAERLEPGPAFFAYFAHMVDQASVDYGLAGALSQLGYDVEEAAARAGYDIKRSLGSLLRAAQEAGDVRDDIDVDDVKALIAGCLARDDSTDPDARRRVLEITVQGLRAHS
ncbi:TetR/AcrR family transcriptional regulator [Haloactinopolyspora alba]|uniref:TetR/AcrR family transcriptional regulator n=1 Tax=Haloactinopolyspora alba TaxID=648780 RepID=UPI00197AA963|nr:TetR/AcrR family transcriptional regulator [Haloactinopolyspora alba]